MEKALKKKILISFVGTNDAGALLDKPDGAILTALQNEKFDEVILLWNEANVSSIKYSDILLYIKRKIKKGKLASKVTDFEFFLKDVTAHNEIYVQLKEFADSLTKNAEIVFTAAISSGTPSMQVCWILLAESGEFSEKFPFRLVKVSDPKFGKSGNVEVKLDTTLPKIIGLKKEIANLKKDLVPIAELNIGRGELKIGEPVIKLAPTEFCYYRYFAERVVEGLGDERFSGFTVSLNFMKEIFRFHGDSFEFLDTNRFDLGQMIKKHEELSINTFRGNISKIKKKIKNALNNATLSDLFTISIEGGRGAKFYGIKVSPYKFAIKK